jgi:PKD repeat protein
MHKITQKGMCSVLVKGFVFLSLIALFPFTAHAIVIINPPPVVSFTGSPTTTCAGDSVQFNNTTTFATTYAWTFQGGSPATSTAVNPKIGYAATGTYSVTLVATGTGGTTTLSKTNYITVQTCTPSPGLSINSTGATADGSAILDLNTGNSGNEGLLLPNVTLTGTTDAATIPNPATSLMVYNAGGALGINLLYNKGTPAAPSWKPLGVNSWLLTGNSPTIDTAFVGTVDAKPLSFKASGSLSGYIDITTQNTLWGYQCVSGFQKNTTVGWGVANNGNECTGIGSQVLVAGNTGNFCTTMGSSLDLYQNTGNDNTAVGFEVLYGGPAANNKASSNTGVGDSALWNNVNAAGGENSAHGYMAQWKINGAFGTTSIGSRASAKNTTGKSNTATGYDALTSNTGGSTNSGFGNYVLKKTTSGAGQAAVGDSAGVTNTTGTQLTMIGYNADVASNALTNCTAIGDTATVHASNTMEFGNQKVIGWGFGGAVPTTGTAASQVFIVGTTGTNGNGAYLSGGGAWTNVSDRNKKENFANVNGEVILTKLDKLPILQWNYKGEPSRVKHIGPMAQDFYRIFAVGNDSLSISSIDPAAIALVGIKVLNKNINDTHNNQNYMQQAIDQLNSQAKACLDNKNEDLIINNNQTELNLLKQQIKSLHKHNTSKP